MTSKTCLRELWERYPPISSLLPVKLSNDSTMERLEVTCSDCGVPCLQDDCRGEVELTPLGAKFRMINRCCLCGKFNFMSGDCLMSNDGSWYLAFPTPGSPMVNPWTGEVIPVRRREAQ